MLGKFDKVYYLLTRGYDKCFVNSLDGNDLPEDMMNALLKSRNANSGVFNLRQVC